MNDSKRQMRASMKQEKEGMEALGGQRHGGSGAAWSRKGDGRVNANRWTDLKHTLVEFKMTGKKSISLKSADLEKITNEAILEGRVALLGIRLNGRDYIVLDSNDYEEMVHAIEQLTEQLEGEGSL